MIVGLWKNTMKPRGHSLNSMALNKYIYIYIYIYLSLYIYIYIYVYIRLLFVFTHAISTNPRIFSIFTNICFPNILSSFLRPLSFLTLFFLSPYILSPLFVNLSLSLLVPIFSLPFLFLLIFFFSLFPSNLNMYSLSHLSLSLTF